MHNPFTRDARLVRAIRRNRRGSRVARLLAALPIGRGR